MLLKIYYLYFIFILCTCYLYFKYMVDLLCEGGYVFLTLCDLYIAAKYYKYLMHNF